MNSPVSLPIRVSLPGHSPRSAFSLVEMLVGFVVLMLLVVMLLGITTNAQWIWSNARGRIDAAQMARAVFLQMERELAAAVSSDASFSGAAKDLAFASWRFVQNPALPQGTVLAGTDSVFWQTSAVDTPLGDISNVGYFVNPQRQLVRFFAPPDIESRFPTLGPEEAFGLNRAVPARPKLRNDAGWWTWLNPTEEFDTSIDNRPSKVASVLGEGVAGFWIRCHDVEALPIRVDLVTWAGTPMRFDSAFPQTHRRLPGAVECVLAIFEPSVLNRFRDQISETFPVQQPIGVTNSDDELLKSINSLIESSLEAGLPAPRVFRATFKVPSGTYRP